MSSTANPPSPHTVRARRRVAGESISQVDRYRGQRGASRVGTRLLSWFRHPRTRAASHGRPHQREQNSPKSINVIGVWHLLPAQRALVANVHHSSAHSIGGHEHFRSALDRPVDAE